MTDEQLIKALRELDALQLAGVKIRVFYRMESHPGEPSLDRWCRALHDELADLPFGEVHK